MTASNDSKRIGTFIPLSSLRSQPSIDLPNGTFSDGLFFLDWLAKTKQRLWQMLPIHENHLSPGSSTKRVPSPYKGYGIGIAPKYLGIERPAIFTADQFIQENSDWLSDYALFYVLKNKYGTDDWTKWEPSMRNRNSEELLTFYNQNKDDIKDCMMQQWQLHCQYAMLREKANRNDILLIGDLSFYLPLRSPLVWIYQRAFKINPDGTLPAVSGVPDEPGSLYGRQVWGHPLYNWENSEELILELFNLRTKYLASLYHMIRLDHANGFFHYGVINPSDQREDYTQPGPGVSVFNKYAEKSLGLGVKLFVEDAGANLKDLRTALYSLQISGVRVLRAGYNEKLNIFEEDYLKTSAYPPKSVAYTTTHDTETLVGFLDILTPNQKTEFLNKTNTLDDPEIYKLAAALRQKVIESPSEYVVIQMQDWLLSKERINIPGTEKTDSDLNWSYRLDRPIEELPHITY